MQEKLNLLQLQTALNIKHIARSLSVAYATFDRYGEKEKSSRGRYL